MRAVSFQGAKFKKVEDEEAKERRKRDQLLTEKKRFLETVFAETESVNRHTQEQLTINASEAENPGLHAELDRLVQKNQLQQQELNKLQGMMQLSGATATHDANFDDDISQFKSKQHPSSSMQQQNTHSVQFSRIFSRSYYRSTSLEYFQSQSNANPQEIQKYLETVKENIENAEINASNENERTGQIQNQLSQLFKTKQKLKHQLTEIENIFDASSKRFDGVDVISYQAKERRNMAFKQLAKIKAELSEQDSIRKQILSRQEELREKESEGRREEEDEASALLLKIDELQVQYEDTNQQLESILEQQRNIVAKRTQSKYILDYISFFERFHWLFQGKQVQEDEIRRLYELSQQNPQGQLMEDNEVLETDGSNMGFIKESTSMVFQKDPRKLQEQQHLRKSSMNSRITDKGDQQKLQEGDEKGDDQNMMESKSQVEQDQQQHQNTEHPLERSELIAKIEGFERMNHPNGIDSFVDGILKVLNEQRYYKEAYNEVYEQLLHGKTVLTQELQAITQELDTLKQNNLFVAEMNKNEAESQRIESIQEALDAGYLRLNNNTNTDQNGQSSQNTDDQAKQSSQPQSLRFPPERNFTTVKIALSGVRTIQNDVVRLTREIKWRKTFFFNFFMNYGEWILRVCRIVHDIFNDVLGQSPSQQSQLQLSVLQKKCQEATEYIQAIWNLQIGGGNNNENNTIIINGNNNNNNLNLPSSQPLINSRHSIEFQHIEDAPKIIISQNINSNNNLIENTNLNNSNNNNNNQSKLPPQTLGISPGNSFRRSSIQIKLNSDKNSNNLTKEQFSSSSSNKLSVPLPGLISNNNSVNLSSSNSGSTNNLPLISQKSYSSQQSSSHQPSMSVKRTRKRFKQVMIEKYKEEDIIALFSSIFGENSTQTAKEFFGLIKEDRLVWFFCDWDCLEGYLLDCNNNQNEVATAAAGISLISNPISNSQSAIENFQQLEVTAVQECSYKLNEMYNFFTGILNALEQESVEIAEFLKIPRQSRQEKAILASRQMVRRKHGKGADEDIDFWTSQNDNGYEDPSSKLPELLTSTSQNPSGTTTAIRNQKIQTQISNAIKRQEEYLNSTKEDEIQQGNDDKTINAHTGEPNVSQTKRDEAKYKTILDFIDTQHSSRVHPHAQMKDYYSNLNKSQSQNNNRTLFSQQSQKQKDKRNVQFQQQYGSNISQTVGQQFDKEQLQQQLSTQQTQQLGGQQQQTQITGGIEKQLQQQQSSQQGQANIVSSSTSSNVNQALGADNNNTLQGQSSGGGNILAQQTSSSGSQSQGILKRKNIKTLEYKSQMDVLEDMFIEEEASRQKEQERQNRLAFLAKEKADSLLSQAGLQSNQSASSTSLLGAKKPSSMQNLPQWSSINVKTASGSSELREIWKKQQLLSRIDVLDRKTITKEYPQTSKTSQQLLQLVQPHKQSFSMTQMKFNQTRNNEENSSNIIENTINWKNGKHKYHLTHQFTQNSSKNQSYHYNHLMPPITAPSNTTAPFGMIKKDMNNVNLMNKSSSEVNSRQKQNKSEIINQDNTNRKSSGNLQQMQSHSSNNPSRLAANKTTSSNTQKRSSKNHSLTGNNKNTNNLQDQQMMLKPSTGGNISEQLKHPVNKLQRIQKKNPQNSELNSHRKSPIQSMGSKDEGNTNPVDFQDFPFFYSSMNTQHSPTTSLYSMMNPSQYTYAAYSPTPLLSSNFLSNTNKLV